MTADSYLAIDSRQIAVQHVEVFNPAKRSVTERRKRFADGVHGRLNDDPAFTGFLLQILDGQDIDFWQSLSDGENGSLVIACVQLILSKKASLRNLPCERSYEFSLPSTPIRVSVTRLDSSLQTTLTVVAESSWNERAVDVYRLLVSAVRDKTNKGYPKLRDPFWLLAWSVDAPWFQDAAFGQARDYLQMTSHPFDAVWAVTLRSSSQRIVRIWPDPLGWDPDDAKPIDDDLWIATFDFVDGIDVTGRPLGLELLGPHDT